MVNVSNMPQTISDRKAREWFVLFAICVAGKSAKQTEKKLNEFLGWCGKWGSVDDSPFEIVNSEVNTGTLSYALKLFKMGQYKRIEKAFREVIKLDVMKDLTVEKLEKIPGIGPKTARFIVLYTDPEANCVPLDTHILKYLAAKYPDKKIPRSTPSKGSTYNLLENLFQYEAEIAGKSVRQLDTEVWRSYANL